MRIFENKPGVVYDATKTTVIFAEDMNEIQARLAALEAGNPPPATFTPDFSTIVPTEPRGLYYTTYGGSAALDSYSEHWNVLRIFQAGNDGGGVSIDGNVVLYLPGNFTLQQFITQIQTCRARGQLVQIVLGGAGLQVEIDTQTKADNLYNSLKAINVQLGGTDQNPAFDGLDLNHFEGVSFSQVSADYTIDVISRLKEDWGNDFFISSPVAAFAGGQADLDRLYMANLYNAKCLDFIQPQFYDPSNLNTVANVQLYLTHYNTTVQIIGGVDVTIPSNRIGIGFMVAHNNVATTSRWNIQDAKACYDQMIAEGRTPKGYFIFATYYDGALWNEAPFVAEFTGAGASPVAFSADFEGGLPGGFASVGTSWGGGVATLDTTSKVNGANSLAVGATAEGSAFALYDHGSDVDELYVRASVFIPTAYSVGASNYQGFMNFLSDADVEQVRLNIENAALDLTVAGANFGPGYTNTTLDLPRNQVFTIEIRVKKSATVGRVQIWINNNNEGAPDYDSGDVNTAATLMQRVRIGNSYAPGATTDRVYFDDVKIDNAFIGTRS